MIETMAVRECPTPDARFEFIVKASIEMAAKLRLDEAYINSKGHPMDVDGVEGQDDDVKLAPHQQSNQGQVTGYDQNAFP